MIKEQIRELEKLTTYLKDTDKKIIAKAINFSERLIKISLENLETLLLLIQLKLLRF